MLKTVFSFGFVGIHQRGGFFSGSASAPAAAFLSLEVFLSSVSCHNAIRWLCYVDVLWKRELERFEDTTRNHWPVEPEDRSNFHSLSSHPRHGLHSLRRQPVRHQATFRIVQPSASLSRIERWFGKERTWSIKVIEVKKINGQCGVAVPPRSPGDKSARL